jgi:acylphosphatase
VFFRDTLRRMASSRGVAGWGRNNPDGTLEAVLEGERADVEAVVAFCRRGPRGAAVEHLDINEEEPEDETGFAIV